MKTLKVYRTAIASVTCLTFFGEFDQGVLALQKGRNGSSGKVKNSCETFNNQGDYDEYLPEDWKTITKEQLEAGHGGMDYVMMKHYLTCLKEGRPMPIDVYDAVSWMSITALSEQSIANGSMPVECPDFTRGKYKTRKTVDVLDIPIIKK